MYSDVVLKMAVQLLQVNYRHGSWCNCILLVGGGRWSLDPAGGHRLGCCWRCIRSRVTRGDRNIVCAWLQGLRQGSSRLSAVCYAKVNWEVCC